MVCKLKKENNFIEQKERLQKDVYKINPNHPKVSKHRKVSPI